MKCKWNRTKTSERECDAKKKEEQYKEEREMQWASNQSFIWKFETILYFSLDIDKPRITCFAQIRRQQFRANNPNLHTNIREPDQNKNPE